MDLKQLMQKSVKYDINKTSDHEKIINLGIALSNQTRINLLTLVNLSPMTITELSHKLYISTSAVMFHVDLLEKAGLVKVECMNKKQKTIKVIRNFMLYHNLDLSPKLTYTQIMTEEFNVDMPIGAYSNLKCKDRFGVILDGNINLIEKFSPKRFSALIIWCDCGYIEYDFPCNFFKEKEVLELNFTMEICSEAPNYRLDWKSDISFYINNKKLATYTSPSDFGGRRGKLNPSWWPDRNTQYGQLIKICITKESTYLNGELVSNIGLDNLDLHLMDKFSFKIENEKDAKHVGGFNLFSEHFGDYNQGLKMTAIYKSNPQDKISLSKIKVT